jgi:hypothetical protein
MARELRAGQIYEFQYGVSKGLTVVLLKPKTRFSSDWVTLIIASGVLTRAHLLPGATCVYSMDLNGWEELI